MCAFQYVCVPLHDICRSIDIQRIQCPDRSSLRDTSSVATKLPETEIILRTFYIARLSGVGCVLWGTGMQHCIGIRLLHLVLIRCFFYEACVDNGLPLEPSYTSVYMWGEMGDI